MNRREILAFGLASLSTLSPASVFAQGKYPDRPIKLVVPFSPGGLVDVIGRLWVSRVQPHLGTVFIENKSGASGTIGSGAVADAQPDGYTILLGNASTQILVPAVMSHPPYDSLKDFSTIAIICVSTTLIAVNPSVPARTLKELIAYVKAHPTKLSYGSAGAGTMTNLAGELFKQLTATPNIAHVGYKGVGAGLKDLIGGHIPMMVANMTGPLLDLHKSGKVRILAVNAVNRLKVASDIPTAIEAGVPGMVLQVFNGLFAPAKTSRAIIDRLAQATHAVMQEEEFQKTLIKSGFEPVVDSTPEKAQQYVIDENSRLMSIIKRTNFKFN